MVLQCIVYIGSKLHDSPQNNRIKWFCTICTLNYGSQDNKMELYCAAVYIKP
jgi:hypothetical protein